MAESPESECIDATSEPSSSGGIELDAEQLSPGALRGLIEEFVTREGTDYGAGHEPSLAGSTGAAEASLEWSLEDKVTQVYRQLASGEARIVFDFQTESASICSTKTRSAALNRMSTGDR